VIRISQHESSGPAFRLVPIDRGNAALVGDVFRTAYGDSFPVAYVYQEDALLEEITRGRLAAALALDGDNRAAGYVSMFKNAPNQNLWEAGNLVVVPDYKQTDVSSLLFAAYFNGVLSAGQTSDGLMGEAVCCHYFTQVGNVKAGAADVALELDQLDGPSFIGNHTGSARVSCVLAFLENSAPNSPIYLPAIYAPILAKLLQPLRPRVLLQDAQPLPTTGTTRFDERYYQSVQTRKFFVHSIGADWSCFAADVVAEAKRGGVVSLQITLNMACPQLDTAVQVLKSHGFFFGGLAPRWFGPDGLLMQLVLGQETEYEHIKLYSATAKQILAWIQAERFAM
jgi:hypothetical protein